MLKTISTLIGQIASLTNATVPLAGTETVPIDQSGAKKVTVANLTKGRTIQTTGINDNNNNEVITITTTASAVNEITVANAATGANPVISATGSDTNIGITLTPKGTGNAVLTSGNLVVANGSGIDFAATSSGTGVMTSELLNDYEEGTWTPAYSSASGSVTTTSPEGKYVKIGKTVYVTGVISGNSGTGSGTLVISGLPFTAMATSNYGTGYCAVVPGMTWGYSGVLPPAIMLANNSSSFIRLWDAATNYVTVAGWMGTGGATFAFSMVYEAI